MRNKYKLPLHIKNYVKKELYDFDRNKIKIQEMQSEINSKKSTITSRSLLIATQRIQKIELVLNKLPKEDRTAVTLIFFKGHSQVYAEVNDNITKDMYYNIMNKMIYLTALELELI